MSVPLAYVSSRDATLSAGFGAALLRGLAPDGGLYVPSSWPRLAPADFAGASTLPEVARPLLAPFLARLKYRIDSTTFSQPGGLMAPSPESTR